MAAPAVDDDVVGFLVGEGGLIDAFAGDRIEDIGQGHQAGGHRDGIAGQGIGVAAAVPFLVVVAGDLLGDGEEFDRLFCIGFGLGDGVAAQFGMGLHDFEFFRAQLAGLLQDVVGNADLADIVQRRRAGNRIDAAFIEVIAETRVVAQGAGQGQHVTLGTQQVAAGFRVAGFSEAGQGADADFLDQDVFVHAADNFGLEEVVLVAQDVAGFLQFELGADAGEDNAGTDRLGDVIDGAFGQAMFLVGRGIHRRDEDHRDIAGLRAGL